MEDSASEHHMGSSAVNLPEEEYWPSLKKDSENSSDSSDLRHRMDHPTCPYPEPEEDHMSENIRLDQEELDRVRQEAEANDQFQLAERDRYELDQIAHQIQQWEEDAEQAPAPSQEALINIVEQQPVHPGSPIEFGGNQFEFTGPIPEETHEEGGLQDSAQAHHLANLSLGKQAHTGQGSSSVSKSVQQNSAFSRLPEEAEFIQSILDQRQQQSGALTHSFNSQLYLGPTHAGPTGEGSSAHIPEDEVNKIIKKYFSAVVAEPDEQAGQGCSKNMAGKKRRMGVMVESEPKRRKTRPVGRPRKLGETVETRNSAGNGGAGQEQDDSNIGAPCDGGGQA